MSVAPNVSELRGYDCLHRTGCCHLGAIFPLLPPDHRFGSACSWTGSMVNNILFAGLQATTAQQIGVSQTPAVCI